LRMTCHALFDQLWRGDGRRMSRKSAYKYMQAQMGMTADEAHIGKFDAEQCRRLISILKGDRA